MTTDKGGAPEIVLTDEQIVEVEELAAYLTVEDLSDYFGFSHDTFNRLRKRDDRVLRAYKKGRACKKIIFAKAYEEKSLGINTKFDAEGKILPTKGDMAGLIFFLKTQCQWSEKQVIETQNQTLQKRFVLEVDSGTTQD